MDAIIGLAVVPFVLILVGGIVAVQLVLWSILLPRLRRSGEAVANDPAFAGAVVLEAATYGGGDGDGFGKVVGLGSVGLTADTFVFVLRVPRRELRIPLRSITALEIADVLRMPGRYRKARRPWLVVEWATPTGITARSGFLLADPVAWQARLSSASGPRP
jgi:hypothetical protein